VTPNQITIIAFKTKPSKLRLLFIKLVRIAKIIARSVLFEVLETGIVIFIVVPNKRRSDINEIELSNPFKN